MKLYIKYMVSIRCKMVVKEELEKLNLNCIAIDLGTAEIEGDLTEMQHEKLKAALLKSGLELMLDKKTILTEQVTNVIIEMIHHNEEIPKVNYSDYIKNKLGVNYTYLSKVFSEIKGITVEHFIIAHKIERAKELLLYDELNLTQISYVLNYSSVSHLSRQFKKVTGLTPRFFKQLKDSKRNTLHNI